jgi:thioredoxin-related protein
MRRFLERQSLPIVFASLFLIVGCQEAPTAAVYSVKEYDPARDPASDLVATVQAAQAGKKQILLQVGGDWCSWCRRLDNFIATHPAVARVLAEDFIIQKVNYSEENQNAEFLAQFPKIEGYPHWFVLDSEGKLLHSQSTGVLEAGESYSEPTVLIYLRSWTSESESLPIAQQKSRRPLRSTAS